MSEDAQAACVKCGAAGAGTPVTVLITAGSAAVTGGRAAEGPFCGGCEAERQHLYALFAGSEGLGFCGCGCPDDAYAFIRDMLALAPFYEHRAAVQELTGEKAHYFVLYALDRAGLLEHGSNIRGSWLTAKGTHYLALMRRWEWDDFAAAGFPHHDDDGDCGPGCPHWEAATDEYVKIDMRREAAKWQRVPADIWTGLDGADASILLRWPSRVQSRPGKTAGG